MEEKTRALRSEITAMENLKEDLNYQKQLVDGIEGDIQTYEEYLMRLNESRAKLDALLAKINSVEGNLSEEEHETFKKTVMDNTVLPDMVYGKYRNMNASKLINLVLQRTIDEANSQQMIIKSLNSSWEDEQNKFRRLQRETLPKISKFCEDFSKFCDSMNDFVIKSNAL